MIYESRCNSCGKLYEYIKPASQYLDSPFCCGERTEKVILNAPMGHVVNIHYTSPIDGRPITTKQARIDDLKRNNSRPWEGLEQEKKVAQERKKYEEKIEDKKLEAAAVQAWQSLKPEQRRILETT